MDEKKKNDIFDDWLVHGVKTPFIGRENELQELQNSLENVINYLTPSCVTIIGNSGIGKTRFLTEFFSKIKDTYKEVRVFRGVTRKESGSFNIISRILRARFGIAEGMDPDVIRNQIREQVSTLLNDKRVTEFLHFLGAFMNIKFPESPFIKAIEENPDQFQNISRTILKRFFEIDCSHSPMIITFEDIHWADEESLDLIYYLINNVEESAIMFVAIASPELLVRRHQWFEGKNQKFHNRIDLGPLNRDESEKLLSKMLSKVEEIPEELIEIACDMAGGNPMFLEQMIRVFIESKVVEIVDENKWIVHPEHVEEINLPLTVEDAVQARITALSPTEIDLLEKAVAMGSVFWLDALVSLSRMDRNPPELWGGSADLLPHIKDILTGLMERDYILKLPDSTFVNDEEYAFKHNLEREKIKNMTNPESKKKYHKLIAYWLDYRYIERDEDQLETIAVHYEDGGDPVKAGYYYLKAGDVARNKYAYKKAMSYYNLGLSLLGDIDWLAKIETLHNLGDVYQRDGQFDKALQCFEDMRLLAWKLDNKSKGGASHNRIGRISREKGEFDQAMRHLGTALALFRLANDERGISSSLDDIGKVHWLKGEYELALKQFKEALSLRRKIGDKRSIALSLSNLGLVYQDSGYYKDAIEAIYEALELRKEVGDLHGVIISLNNLGTIYQDKGEQEKAIELWQEGLKVGRQIDDKLSQAYLLTNIGVAQYQLGWYDDSIKTLTQSYELSAQIGEKVVQGESSRALGKSYMYKGDFLTSRRYLREAMEIFEQIKSKVHLGVVLRSMGELTNAAGWGEEEINKAREYFEKSLDIFEELGNELELGRTLRSYSKLLDQVGIKEVAEQYKQKAERIFTKLKVSSISVGSDKILNEIQSVQKEKDEPDKSNEPKQ